MTKRTLSAKQLAVLAAGRAKAKANRDKVETTLSYVQTPVLNIETAKPAGLSHDAARAKLKELGLGGQRLPGRAQTLVVAGHSIYNHKGTFHFSKAEAAPGAGSNPVPELPAGTKKMTIEEVIAALQFMTRHDLKI